MTGPPPFDARALADDLRGVLGDRVSVSNAVRDHHSRGEAHPASHPPDVVVFPESTSEVSEIVRIIKEEAAQAEHAAE